ncbi:unnamed protein product [Clonostachys rosea]|uniref:Zn(2)-C6 fungal-type domain-containing protein n=1 Tax=Bionectria ochroleuca TaxID=29856 RepID=A0ABY6V2N5_BIOOC|nr:unnamed protein product [Clonostachys rosea]
MASSSAQGKKHKANTACNTCRQRKTRCDGEKPSCSYCRTTGGQCVYRVVYNESSSILNIDSTDQSVLDRLARVEARLELLDHLPPESNHSYESSFPRRPFGTAANISDILPTIDAPNIQ